MEIFMFIIIHEIVSMKRRANKRHIREVMIVLLEWLYAMPDSPAGVEQLINKLK